MRTLFVVTAIAACGMSACAAEPRVESVDLTSIPRTIKLEPRYESESPKYCLAVFGKKAAHRVWLVHDGDRLFVDRDGDGELIEPPISIGTGSSFSLSYLSLPKTYRRYTDFAVYPRSDGSCRIQVTMDGRGRQYVGASSNLRPKFGDSPETAPVIHFDGRMTLGQFGPTQTLSRRTEGRSYRTTSLKLMVGTPGLGEGTFAAFHCKCRRKKTLRGTIAYSRGEYSPYVERVSYKMHG